MNTLTGLPWLYLASNQVWWNVAVILWNVYCCQCMSGLVEGK